MLDKAISFANAFLDALRRADIPDMPQYCQYPVLLSTPKGSVLFQEPQDSMRAVGKIISTYVKSGLPSFDAELLEVSQLTPSSFILCTHMRTKSAEGEILGDGPYAFIVQSKDGDLKLTTVIADGPVASLIAEHYPLDDWKQ